MKLNELAPAPGSTKVAKRKGRGHGTGNGKTAGRGHKGQGARAGGGKGPGFEGGQMPLHRILPKRGFNNIFAKEYSEINVGALSVFNDGDVVGPQELAEKGLLSKERDGLKVLGHGELSIKLTVKAARFTQTAKEKIEAAGGKAEVV